MTTLDVFVCFIAFLLFLQFQKVKKKGILHSSGCKCSQLILKFFKHLQERIHIVFKTKRPPLPVPVGQQRKQISFFRYGWYESNQMWTVYHGCACTFLTFSAPLLAEQTMMDVFSSQSGHQALLCFYVLIRISHCPEMPGCSGVAWLLVPIGCDGWET